MSMTNTLSPASRAARIAAVLLSASASLAADIVTLRNGSIIEGSLVSGDSRNLTVSTPGGTQSIAVLDVAYIQFGSGPGIAPQPSGLAIPPNTAITVRMIDAIDSQTGAE